MVVRGRYIADMSHAAPIEPHAVIAQWEGDHVTIWSSTQVPFPARSTVAHTLADPRGARAHDRAAARWRLRRQVRAALRGPRRGARPRGGRPVKLVFSRREEFTVPDHRREGMAIELETGIRRDGTLVARRGNAGDRQRGLHGGCRVLPAARRDARGRPVPRAAHLDRSGPRLHEQRALRLGAGAHRPPGVLGARAAHGRGRARDRAGSRRTAPP